MRLSSLVAELMTHAFKQKVRCKSWFPRRITSVIASRWDVSVVEKGHVVVFKYRTMSVSSTKDGIVDKIALMMEAVRTSETSVYFNKTTRRYISYSPPWEHELSLVENRSITMRVPSVATWSWRLEPIGFRNFCWSSVIMHASPNYGPP
jgi:hypothetical protein